jgi:hypothetical protein
MDPHGPTVTWLHVIKTAPDQGNFPHWLRKPGVMAHQEDDITLFPSFIEALCASLILHQISKKTSTGPCRESPQGDGSCRIDDSGAVHQEYWPMAIHSR